ncbi:DUF167 domain-containing protein [Leifsonia sp. A12D58]|uniref:DUF167 domain-containing protein n=1 Tax=Leifsonia sp. A12D58 TaxID=3397674 RepID=UPI0039E0DAD5
MTTLNLTVRVKPGSRKGPLVVSTMPADAESVSGAAAVSSRLAEPEVTVYLQERAVDGAANDALIRVLATHYGVARSAVSIIRGHAARVKQVRVVS